MGRTVLGRFLLALGLAAGFLAVDGPANAQTGDGGGSDARIDAGLDDDTAGADIEVTIPGDTGSPDQQSGGGAPQPNCTRSDGTPDFLRYEGLQWTTMEEQRTEIRPEEQRPGVYLHVYCGDEHVDFRFFPDVPEQAAIDPRTLADSVQITPAAPVISTNPASGSHLVNLEAWFWAENWSGAEETATAGPVSVTVSARPTMLVIDPGDGTASFSCAGPQPAYDARRPPDAQQSNCTHTYRRAGEFTATATIVYSVSFTSNVGVNGDLGTIEPDSTIALRVREAQAIVTG
jgi:hypothetical protein